MSLKSLCSFCLWLLVTFLFSDCTQKDNKKESESSDSLVVENNQLRKQISEKDSLIKYFMLGFTEIHYNLTEMRNRQLKITSNANKNGDKQAILDNIKIIDRLMEKNKATISLLKDKLQNSTSAATSEYGTFIQGLDSMITERDNEISGLLDNLEKMNYEMGSLADKYANAVEENSDKTKKLNTAWYTAGTESELIAKGVISKEGGFIGIGKTRKLSSHFNHVNFSQVDIMKLKSVKISAKKVKLITTHPAESYSIAGSGGLCTLFISNPEKFWSASKYLVVLIEKK